MTRQNWLLLSLVVGFLFLLASYIPNFYEASIANLLPADRVLTPAEHMYTYDYNVYLSKIKQGTEGRWTIVDKYTNDTNQKGALLQILYVKSGKIGGIFNLSPPLIFHALRTILSSIWVLTIVYLNFYFFKKPFQAFCGVVLSLFAASWPVFYQYQNSTWIGMHMSWWQELDVLKRISYIPHYTLNYILISILTLLLSNYSNNFKFLIFNSKSIFNNLIFKHYKLNKNFKFQISNFQLMTLVLFISFFIHPSSGLLFLISWIIFHSLNLLWFTKYSHRQIIKIIYDTVILILVAAIPLLYFQYLTADYPWKSLTDYDKLNRIGVNLKEYALALGPVLLTGVAGGIVVFIRKEQKYLSLLTWLLGAFLAILVFKKFPQQSELRFVQTANHIPLALLSVYFLSWLIEKFPNLFVKFITFLAVILIVILGIAQSYFSVRAQTDFTHQRVVAGQPLVPFPPQVMYPLKDMFNTFVWLDKNTKNEEVVLSHVYAGNYIPAYSGNYVYLGHNPETPNYNDRVNKLEKFYSGTLPLAEAHKFLKDEKISYVLYGPQEKQKSVEDIKKYNFLKPVLTTNQVTLFKVD